MRCSKCGYISFDHLETCKKCNKSGNTADSDLNGTVFDTAVPSFLRLTKSVEPDVPDADFVDQEDGYRDDFQLPSMEAVDAVEVERDNSSDDEGVIFNLDDIVLDSEERELDENDEIILDLDDLEEAAALDDFSLEAEEQEEAEGTITPTIDFGDLDISDLGPPIEDALVEENELELAPAAQEGMEELVLDKEEPRTEIKQEKEAFGLEDLLLDELDLEKIDTTTIGKSSTKSLKTGTALDNFDVDLGELFTEDEQ